MIGKAEYKKWQGAGRTADTTACVQHQESARSHEMTSVSPKS